MQTLEELIFHALGQASMCWSEIPQGVFDDMHAKQIGDELIRAIRNLPQANGQQAETAPENPSILDEARQVVRQTEAAGEPIVGSSHDQIVAKGYVEAALAELRTKEPEGTWCLGDIQTMLVTQPFSGVYSLQIWFVVLLDKERMQVRGRVYIETRD